MLSVAVTLRPAVVDRRLISSCSHSKGQQSCLEVADFYLLFEAPLSLVWYGF